jgi:uncharacterized protein YoxC
MNEKETPQTFIRDNIFKLAAIAVAILNIWIATQLSPLESHIQLVAQRVDAIEEMEPITSREFHEICNRLDRIESKIDNIRN